MGKSWMKKNPRVAIGLPVFNGENYLAEALDSILSQSFSDFELLISDNASTDRTAEICQEYAARDDRIRYIRQDRNIGGPANYDFVFHATESPYFKWFAHDDLIGERFLETCVAELDANPDAIGAIPAEIRDIDPTGETTLVTTNDMDPGGASTAQRFRHYVMQGYHNPSFSPLFSLYRRSALAGSQLYGDYRASDRVLTCEMLLHGRIVSTEGSYLSIRRHPEQFTSNYHQGDDYWAAWLDPDSAKKDFYLRDTPYISALTKAAMRAPLGFRERVGVLKTVLNFAWQRRKNLLAETKWRLAINLKSNALGRAMWQTAKRVRSSQ